MEEPGEETILYEEQEERRQDSLYSETPPAAPSATKPSCLSVDDSVRTGHKRSRWPDFCRDAPFKRIRPDIDLDPPQRSLMVIVRYTPPASRSHSDIEGPTRGCLNRMKTRSRLSQKD